jgi:anti-sigma B factor antagonist
MAVDHGVTVLASLPKLDAYTAPRFRAAVAEAINVGYYQLIADLTNTTYIDSSGLGVLVGALKRCTAHGGWLRLAGPSEDVTRLLHGTGLDRVFDVFDTVDAAINHDTEGATTP